MSTQAVNRLGLLVCKPEAVQRLSEPLEQCGWIISQSAVLSNGQVDGAEGANLFYDANAIVVDLDGADNAQLAHLNELVSIEVRPVLFNDSSQDAHWSQRLNDKLAEVLSAVQLKPVADKEDSTVDSDASKPDAYEVDQMGMSGNVWLLSGSLGGPEALREFFSALSPSLPVSFIVMQRIAEEHLDVLANHLKHCTDYSIVAMGAGSILRDGSIVLIADGKCFSIDDQDKLLPNSISPCDRMYDQMMTVVAKRYGSKAGAIVFSAIGEDGMAGCRRIFDAGGKVWLHKDLSGSFVQLAEDCNDSRLTVASPVNLAQQLNALYQ